VDYDFAQVIQHAADRDVGVSVVGPHAGWALTDHAINGGGRHPIAIARHTSEQEIHDDEFHRHEDDPRVLRAKSFSFLSRKGEQSLSQAAVRYALATPGVRTVVGGFSEVSHIEEMVTAARLGPLSSSDMNGIEEVWRNNFWLP
jgi:aryl-alcohol dehydrogenase-like predicted oxidoreductase